MAACTEYLFTSIRRCAIN